MPSDRPQLFRSPVLVIDTETTGFADREWSRVVEVAAVVLDIHGREQGNYNAIVKPDIFDERAAGAVAVHGITREMVEAAGLPTDEAAAHLTEFVDFFFEPGTAWVTSFNTDFDRPMLERMGEFGWRWAPCIMKRAMGVMGPAGALPRRRGSWKWPKLSEAASFFGVTFKGDAHRALADTRAAAEVLVALRLHELEVRPITDTFAKGEREAS